MIAEARELAPDSPVISTAAGQVYLAVGDNEGAALAFRDAVGQQSDSYVPYYALAAAGIGATPGDDREDPIRLLRRSIELNPRFVRSYHELARQLVNSGQPGQAFAPAQTAVGLNPREAYSWTLLGRIALRLSEPATARALGDRGLTWARDPQSKREIDLFLAEVSEYERNR